MCVCVCVYLVWCGVRYGAAEEVHGCSVVLVGLGVYLGNHRLSEVRPEPGVARVSVCERK